MARPFSKKYVIINDGKTVVTEEKLFNELVEQHGKEIVVTKKVYDESEFEEFTFEETNEKEIVLEKAPQPEINVDDLPKVVNVVNKKSGRKFTVTREHYLMYREELKLG